MLARIAVTAQDHCTIMLSVNSTSAGPDQRFLRIPRMNCQAGLCRADRLTATRAAAARCLPGAGLGWLGTAPIADRQDEASLLGERDELFGEITPCTGSASG